MSNKKMKKAKKLNLWYYFKNHKFALFVYMVCILFANIVGSFFEIIFISDAIEYVSIGEYNNAILYMLFFVATICICKAGIFTGEQIYNTLSKKIKTHMSLDLARQVYKLNSNTYANHSTGTMVQRIVNDPNTVLATMQEFVWRLTTLIGNIVVLCYVFYLNWIIGLVIIAVILFCTIFEKLRFKIKTRNLEKVNEKNDKINALTTEIVKSEKDIKSLGLEDRLGGISQKYFGEYCDQNTKYLNQDFYFWFSRNFVLALFEVIIMILGIYFVDKGLMTLAAFMVIYANTQTSFNVASGTGVLLDMVSVIKVSLKRMFSLFDEKEFVTEKFGDKNIENIVGKINFSKVSYAYKENGENLNNDDKNSNQRKKNIKIFKNLTFEIKPNTTVAFVGKSGSGKTTILNLITKMYDADSGKILIDDIDIQDFSKDSLRNSISLVNQFPYIFNMSIKDNLLLIDENASDKDLWEVLDKASLKEFVKNLPKKLDTIVGEGGIKLSGGQRQRLAICRALLRKSPIIIFDESTSSLDNYAQNDIKESIDKLKGQSTIVIVAHRLSTIKNVDKIFFLDDGVIKGEGTFEELIHQNEEFKKLFFAGN